LATGNFFFGAFTRIPGVRAGVDDSGLTPIQIGSPRTVAIIGKADGGIPKTPILISLPQQASQMLRSGELLEATLRCFNASPEVRGASLVYIVRVDPATAASKALLDAGGGTTITLNAVNYGPLDNQIKASVANGTTVGKKITLKQGLAVYAKDDLYQAALTIQYTGAGSASTLTINATSLVTGVTGGPGGETLNLVFTSYATIQALADAIDANPAYTAVVNHRNPQAATANAFDFVTTVDLKTAPVIVTSTLQAIVDWLNSGAQDLVTAVRGATGLLPANITDTYLTGGANGSVVNQDWQDCFDALQTKDVAFVCPISGDASLHAMAVTHAQLMSASGKTPRKAFVGGISGEKTATLSNYVARAQAINSDRGVLAVQGVKDYDIYGNLVTFPPYIFAAQMAGMQSGVNEIGDAITHKSMKAVGLEWTPTEGDKEIIIDKGGCLVELVENRGFFRVVRGITTWRQNDAYHRVEISTGIALDEVVRDVIEALEQYVGQKASPLIATRALSTTKSVLKGLEEAQIIVGDDTNRAFKNLMASIAGDTLTIEFDCSPVVPINFIRIRVHATTFSGVITAAVA